MQLQLLIFTLECQFSHQDLYHVTSHYLQLSSLFIMLREVISSTDILGFNVSHILGTDV